MNNFYQEKNSKLIFLLDRIEKQGYSDSINEFINKYPEFSYRFDKKQGSVLLRSINGNNTNLLEKLSNQYFKIYKSLSP